ncbi:carboxylating nicotinate-nucleotide diphosphorylase [Bacillus sp. CGMCC 1.16607]|uniref:carboxylating nicotinate-nucleotide diphosphorylase n=1 Tax=Bacillus sp. CGMCC 1.16607 TaxID=3351842 RepID=UPI0036402B24
MNTLKLRSQLEQFFNEDIGDQDITSDLIFSKGVMGEVEFIAKEEGIFCGEDIIKYGYKLLNEQIQVHVNVKDGDFIQVGQILATASGEISDLLKGERVILNLVQRMSGISTITKKAVQEIDSSTTKLCDTRKTSPGLRMFEKYAVRCGGGFNHRYGLYDGVMIKDNHISFAGSITNAVKRVREKLGHMIKIEVEIETVEQLIEAIEAKVDVIMLDNRSPEEIKQWMGYVPEGIITEASGGITLNNLAAYGKTGVHYISLGFLTHSFKALDISVKVGACQRGEE